MPRYKVALKVEIGLATVNNTWDRAQFHLSKIAQFDMYLSGGV